MLDYAARFACSIVLESRSGVVVVVAWAVLGSSGPGQLRYCIRWRHQRGLLVLKVTDDVEVSLRDGRP